ncbi:hypothetical protein RAH41_14000 [Gottfriedia acidiceleris]|uniref:hypothetical protein n=1 Tax=Gottfriedia acidiceleris TaxID=371036 RepID=UPI002F26D519
MLCKKNSVNVLQINRKWRSVFPISHLKVFGLTIPAVMPVSAMENKGHVTIDSVKFNGMDAPKTIDKMVQTYSNASLKVK